MSLSDSDRQRLDEYLEETLRKGEAEQQHCKDCKPECCYAAGHAAGRIEVARAVVYWHRRGTLEGFRS